MKDVTSKEFEAPYTGIWPKGHVPTQNIQVQILDDTVVIQGAFADEYIDMDPQIAREIAQYILDNVPCKSKS
ncbi:hypothetical protein PS2_97 [Serratia phage PS2]|uniref:Uncharacterized protein n=1 Tax=Serratia phage PS2 TaxID=1481112 RepID=A0A023W4T6_9CAUD|nr:hypothetical protein FF83_gp097 [Serratia phage PS2]AHY25344.1 hypothetical protein PS2_97 [Serratia phage PS2]